MEWTLKEDLQVFPWDTSKTIRERIFLEHGPLVEIRKRGQEWEILDWDLLLGSFMLDTPLADVLREFPKESSRQVLQKHLKRLWLTGDLDEEKWEDLFRYEMDLKDMDFPRFMETMRAQEAEDTTKLREARQFLTISKKLQAIKPYEQLAWRPGLQETRFQLKDTRTIGNIFHDFTFMENHGILLVLLKQKEQVFSKTPRIQNPDVLELLKCEELFQDIPDGIHFYQSNNPPMVLSKTDNQDGYALEVRYSSELFLEQFFSDLQLTKKNIISQKDIGKKGQFVFPDTFLELPLFQDACMNDPILSAFWYVDESKQANFEASLKVTFTPYFRERLGVEKRPFDFTFKNIHRQDGFLGQVQLNSPIPEKNIDFFLAISEKLMQRFFDIHDELMGEYQHLLPDVVPVMFEKQKKAIRKNVKETRPRYFLKYQEIFESGVYATKCQKEVQPVLITEDESRSIDPSRWIRYPHKKIGKFPPDYYYCPTKEAPFAGLTKVKRGESALNFVPCCKKTPHNERNLRLFPKLKLFDGSDTDEEEEEEEEETSVKKDKGYKIGKPKLIKQPGQLGEQLPPSLNRLLLAYNPEAQYYRLGVKIDKNAFLNCILQMYATKGIPILENTEEIRDRMAGDPLIVQACIQDNPGLSLEKIQQDLGNPDVYFDPRRFSRAVEMFFKISVVVFSRPLKGTDVTILQPHTLRNHVSNVQSPPLIFILEHFGGKMDVVGRGEHPHCEIITYRPFSKSDYRFEFQGSMISELLEDVFFRFDGIHPVLPFDTFKANILLEFLVGQSPDGLGKIRLLHFLYKGVRMTATVPPMPVIPNVPLLYPDEPAVLIDSRVVEFLQRFYHWKRLQWKDPSDTTFYWTVVQPDLFYKHNKTAPMEMTFKLRLPEERKDQILQHLGSLPFLIDPQVFSLKTEEEDWLTEEIYCEKRARCLQWITRHLFSRYLVENEITEQSVDPDILLESFRKTHCVFRNTRPPYRQLDRIESFVQDGKVVIPSMAFWSKLAYNLKWHLFYKPKDLMLFHRETREEDVFYQKLSDFIFSDFQHFYCNLNYLKAVYEKSVEVRYELEDSLLGDLKKEKSLWYNPSQSPFPFPSLVLRFSSLQKALNAAMSFIQSGYIPMEVEEEPAYQTTPFAHYTWKDNRWVWKEGEGEEVFTFESEKDCLLLLRSSS